jgi:lactate permease
MTALLALLPILVILVLMLGLRWSAAAAGSVGMGVALAVAVAAFAFPAHADPDLSLGAALAGTGAEAGFTALTILWIIGPALGIHQLQMRTGAAEVLRSALASLCPGPAHPGPPGRLVLRALHGGRGRGSAPRWRSPHPSWSRPASSRCAAVTITLVGHVVGVSFGAIGTPIVPQVAATGLGGLELARATGPYHSLLGWVPLLIMVLPWSRGVRPGRAPPPGSGGGRRWPQLCFLLPYTLLWAMVGPELPTLGGALFGGCSSSSSSAGWAAPRLPPPTCRAPSRRRPRWRGRRRPTWYWWGSCSRPG